MRTLGTGNSAQIERRVSSTWVRVQVEDHLGVLQTHPPFEVDHDQPSVDTPIAAATVRFRRLEGAESFAPLMTANPPLDLGRRIVISIDAGSGSWTEVFSGHIDRIQWPERYGDVTVEARDALGRLMDTFIETPLQYGSEEGEPLEDVMNAVIADNWPAEYGTPPEIYVPAPTGAVVVWPPIYQVPQTNLYDALRGLADTIGAVIHYRYIDGDGWRISLVEPEREKTTPDYTFGGDDYYDVSQMDQDVEDIYNVVEVEYSTAGEARDEEVAIDEDSIDRYGRRYLGIIEAADSPIRTEATAQALADAALSDLSEPDATLEIEAPYFWPGEVGVDLYRVLANGKHFSADQDLAPVAIRHRLALNQRPTSWVRVRGKPSAGVLLWRRRARRDRPVEPDAVYSLQNLRFADEETGRRFYWDNGPGIEEIWTATDVVTGDVTEADWLALEGAVALQGLIDEFLVPWPGEGQRTIGRIEGRWTTPAGNSGPETMYVLKIDVPGTRPPIDVEVVVSENAAGTQATITATVTDPRGVIDSANIYILQNGTETGPTAMGAAGDVYTHTVNLLPKPHITSARGELVRNDGGDPIPFLVPPIDSDKSANVIDALPSYDGAGEATVAVQFDSDTDVGTGTAGYRLDGGSETLIDVDASFRSSVAVTQSTSAAIPFEVRGYNAAGVAGDWFPVTIEKHVPTPAFFPRITTARVTIIEQPITCPDAALDPMTNRVHVTIEDQQAGYTLKVSRYENGEAAAVVASGLALTTTQVDDVITGYISDLGGSFTNASYFLEIITGGTAVHTAWTQVIPQPRTACP